MNATHRVTHSFSLIRLLTLFSRNLHWDISYRNELGAGAIIYLRKIYEKITKETAEAAGIATLTAKGKNKHFKELLEEVDKQKHIIPEEFSK